MICIALYFLLIPFTLSAQFSRSGLKNLPDLPPALDRHAVPWLPFVENWNSGLFETNHWNTEQYGNWRIAGQLGNAAPSTEFYYNPIVNNYQKALTSRLLNARNLIDGDIYLSFDLKTTIVNPTGMEFLKAQVLVDTNWITVWADSNTSSYDWTNKKINISNPVKGNVFRFRFLAEGQNSLDIFNWLIDNISVYRECAPPLNLQAYINFPNIDEVLLEWDPPVGGGSGISAWLGWDNGTNNDAIGLTDEGTFSAAVRFTPAQLGQYSGNYLTKIRFFPYAEASFILNVWTGANAGQLVMTQPVDNVAVGVWNEVELETPVFVSGSTELWFGYTVTHPAGSYPAGVDAGPAVAGFGDMISLDGYAWESMATAYALNYNWNLGGYVEPINNYSQNYTKSSGFNIKPNPEAYTAIRNRELLHYEVFKEGELIGSTVETFYFDEIQMWNTQCYTVRAIYQDCISDPSNEDCIYLESPKRNSSIERYPVPANQTLNIKSETELSSLIITNFNYQPVYQTYNLNSGTITINTSTYGDGIYFIRAIDCAGNIHSSKFIVNH
jgi:hypothetical protein